MTVDMISTLPNETLVMIFSYLDSQSLQQCAKVSNLFRVIVATDTQLWKNKEGSSFNGYFHLIHTHRQLYRMIDQECKATPPGTLKHINIILSNKGSIMVRYCPGYSKKEFGDLKPNERMEIIEFVNLIASRKFASEYFSPLFSLNSTPTVIDRSGLFNVIKFHAAIIINPTPLMSTDRVEKTREEIIPILNKHIDKKIDKTDPWVMHICAIIVLLIALILPTPKW